MSSSRPRLEVFNLQGACRLGIASLARRLRSSVEFLPPPLKGGNPLPVRIEFSLLTLQAIGEVHAQFLDDPEPTDVITFDHGEILICPAVALAQGKAYRRALDEEVLLYGIHGLLHLLGWSDKTPKKQAAMAQEQERVWRRVLAREKKPQKA